MGQVPQCSASLLTTPMNNATAITLTACSISSVVLSAAATLVSVENYILSTREGGCDGSAWDTVASLRVGHVSAVTFEKLDL